MSLLTELKRRNILRVALLYVATGWLVLEASELCIDFAGLPAWVYRFLCGVLLIGFPLALVLSWIYELTPDGVRRQHEVPPSQSITRQTGQRLTRLTFLAVLLVLILVFLRFLLG